MESDPNWSIIQQDYNDNHLFQSPLMIRLCLKAFKIKFIQFSLMNSGLLQNEIRTNDLYTNIFTTGLQRALLYVCGSEN